MLRTETASSDRSDVTLAEGEEHPNPLGQETTPEHIDETEAYAPQLSWFMTVLILSVVSVVSKVSFTQKKRPDRPPTVGCHHCRLVGGNSERDFCNQVYQQGMDSSHSVTYGAGNRRYVGSLAELVVDPDKFPLRLRDGHQRLGKGSIDLE